MADVEQENVLAEAENQVDPDDLVEKQTGQTEQETPVASTMSPELQKYWDSVRENPNDFTGWTYLLQYVEQENDIILAREAFEAFFATYPYCYGYWKKYADLEKRNDNMSEAEQVYERGLQSIPLSVDLWMHFISFYKSKYGQDPAAKEDIRRVYERAITAGGTEFRSDKLWDSYITWETEDKNLRQITLIYDRLLTVPTQLYSHHFENFKTHVTNNHPKEFLTLDEFMKLRAEVVKEIKAEKEATENSVLDGEEAAPGTAETPAVDDVPPGEEDPSPSPAPGETVNLLGLDQNEVQAIKDVSAFYQDDENEMQKVREKVIELREKVHRLTEEEVSKRWNYEEGIRRPYFHVKPLEKSQLKNWKEYLEWEIATGSHERTIILFERCMIACALYEDMWVMYAKFMEPHSLEGVRNIFQRAGRIHLPTKPNLHLQWSAFEEKHGNYEAALEILTHLENAVPGLTSVAVRTLGFHKRQKKYKEASELYEKYIKESSGPKLASFFTVKYARFLNKVTKELQKAKDILNEALANDKNNSKLHMQLVEIECEEPESNADQIVTVLDNAINSDLSQDDRVKFSRRKLEYLEEYGTSVDKILEAYDAHQDLIRDKEVEKRKSESEAGDAPAAKKSKTDWSTKTTTTASTNGYQSYDQSSQDYYNQWGNYNAGYYGQNSWSGYGY